MEALQPRLCLDDETSFANALRLVRDCDRSGGVGVAKPDAGIASGFCRSILDLARAEAQAIFDEWDRRGLDDGTAGSASSSSRVLAAPTMPGSARAAQPRSPAIDKAQLLPRTGSPVAKAETFDQAYPSLQTAVKIDRQVKVGGCPRERVVRTCWAVANCFVLLCGCKGGYLDRIVCVKFIDRIAPPEFHNIYSPALNPFSRL